MRPAVHGWWPLRLRLRLRSCLWLHLHFPLLLWVVLGFSMFSGLFWSVLQNVCLVTHSLFQRLQNKFGGEPSGFAVGRGGPPDGGGAPAGFGLLRVSASCLSRKRRSSSVGSIESSSSTVAPPARCTPGDGPR